MVSLGEDKLVFKRTDKGGDGEAWGWAMGQLEGMTIGHLATVDEGRPRVRPITVLEHGGGHYMITGSDDAKMAQLARGPSFELEVLVEEGERTGYVRLAGEAEVVEDTGLRREVADASGYAYDYWERDDPAMTVLRMHFTSAELMRPGRTEYELLSR